jgi:hypothetical protein
MKVVQVVSMRELEAHPRKSGSLGMSEEYVTEAD